MCKVCDSPQRSQIDLALAKGTGLRVLEKLYPAFSRAGLHRHTRCKPASAESATIAPSTPPSAANGEIAAEIAKLRLAQKAAKRRRDVTGMLAVSRELRAWLALQAKTETVALARPAAEAPPTRQEAVAMSRVLLEAEIKAKNGEVWEWIVEMAGWVEQYAGVASGEAETGRREAISPRDDSQDHANGTDQVLDDKKSEVRS